LNNWLNNIWDPKAGKLRNKFQKFNGHKYENRITNILKA